MKVECSFGLAAIIVITLITVANSLYEDQIKKFDWRRLNVGKLENVYLDLSDSFDNRLIINTKENVIASLYPETGDIIWRQVLEKDPRGSIKLLKKSAQPSRTTAVRHNSNQEFDLLSVQGHAPAIVRGWNSAAGYIEFEWSLMPIQADKAEDSLWFYSNAMLFHVVPVWHSHLEVTQYFPSSGHTTTTTAKITALWIDYEKCLLTGVYFICLDGIQLISLDLTSSVSEVISKQLPNIPKSKPVAVKGTEGVIVVDKKLVAIKDDIKICENVLGSSFLISNYDQNEILLALNVINKVLQIRAFYSHSCKNIDQLMTDMSYPDSYGIPEILAFDCKKTKLGKEECLYILSTADEMIIAVQDNKIKWLREEALAHIIAAELIDLPLADIEGAIESEMQGKPGDILGAFVRRVTGQIHQIKSIFLHVLGLGLPPTDTQKAGLVRDSFGLHKMLVAITKCGKIFGIDNISGKFHWTYYIPTIESFDNDETMRLIVQRTSKHFPLEPLCAVVGRHKHSGNGLIFRFNPITGKETEGGGFVHLNFKIKQITLLPETETDFIKGLLLLDERDDVHVVPETAREMADGMYLFTADKKTSTLYGFFVEVDKEKLRTLLLWNVILGGSNGENRIVAVAMKNPMERVHSQGRVLGDRSVLYKYVNPNLVAVVTQGPDSVHKYVMNIYLIDAVTGGVIFSMYHRKTRAPLHIVHSENWLAYSYYNEKVRRTEITSIELYEGQTQTNSTEWSSFDPPVDPIVERQSYIMPKTVECIRETITERGITNKHVLVGTSNGAIIEIPWAFLDPRRPVTMTTQAQEDGLIPYVPELRLPTENVLNYNQTIARLKNIYTAPSGLESTCLVVAWGLDLFVTRVSPSKTFDLLKEDFDYILITVVLIVLTSGSLIVKHLSNRKILKQAWK